MKYHLKFNPIVTILRLIFICFLVWMFTFLLTPLKETYNNLDDTLFPFLYLSFILLLFSVFFYQSIRGLLTETFLVNIFRDKIEIINLFRATKTVVRKNEISGIYSATKQFAKGSWDSIIIETEDGRRYELVQFNYFHFKQIFLELDRFGFKKSGSLIRLAGIFSNTKEYFVD